MGAVNSFPANDLDQRFGHEGEKPMKCRLDFAAINHAGLRLESLAHDEGAKTA